MRENLRSIGIMIACARHLRGESEESVGRAVGLNASSITRIEQGKYYTLTYKKLIVICRYLQIPVTPGVQQP